MRVYPVGSRVAMLVLSGEAIGKVVEGEVVGACEEKAEMNIRVIGTGCYAHVRRRTALWECLASSTSCEAPAFEMYAIARLEDERDAA